MSASIEPKTDSRHSLLLILILALSAAGNFSDISSLVRFSMQEINEGPTRLDDLKELNEDLKSKLSMLRSHAKSEDELNTTDMHKDGEISNKKNSGHAKFTSNHTFLVEKLSQFNISLTEVDLSVPWRSMKNESALKDWSFVASEVQEAGHPYCSLYKEDWSCTGERYKHVLERTPLFDHSFDLNSFPENSNIYAEGNSHMAQLVTTVVCNTKNVRVWLLGSKDDHSFLVKALDSGVTLILISNLKQLLYKSKQKLNPRKTLPLLNSINFIPDYVLRGPWMWEEHEGQGSKIGTEERLATREHGDMFSDFTNATYVRMLERHLPSTFDLSCRFHELRRHVSVPHLH